ncbi:MAG: LamG domain-containing protein [Polyangiales bacterium]
MMLRLRNLAFAMTVTAGAMSAGAACTAKKNTELVVAVQTDLRIPKDLNAVNIKIVALGGTYFDQTFVVGPGGVHLPQTIGIVPNDDKNLQPVDITVTGKFGADLASATDKVVRRVRVTFGKDRVGLVRMPLRFTCYGDKKINDCGEEQTCIAGECVAIPQLEGTTLPEFTNDAVFGAGGDDKKLGTCWNPDVCLASSVPLQPVGACTWALTEAPSDGGVPMKDATGPGADAMATPDGGSSGGDASFSPDVGATPDATPPPTDAGAFAWKRFEQPTRVSVVVTSDNGLGFCNGTSCKLPLDFDEQEGWSWANDSHTLIKLAPGLCKTIGAATVEATDACDTKTADVPFCDDSSAGNDASINPDSCGGTKCAPGMCGSVPDGCGGFTECGTCGAPMVCNPATHFCTDGAGDSGVPDTSTEMVTSLMVDVSPVPAGGRRPLHAMAQFSSGKMLDVTPLVAWKTGNPAIATIDFGTFELVGVASGFTTLSGTYMGAGGGGDVNVTPGGADAGCGAPLTCAAYAGSCGPLSDGCGGMIACTCTGATTCIAGKCLPSGGDGGTGTDSGPDACVKKTCADFGANCGPVSDGCGGLIATCGTCTAPASCGGGGVPSVCGMGVCTPKTCAMLGYNCGSAADGCGGVISCGAGCVAPATCGGGGMPNVCGGGAAGDASTDTGDAGSDLCGMSASSPPMASTPLKQGWHLTPPTFGTPMMGATSLTATSVTAGGTGFTSGTCSVPDPASLNGTSSYLNGMDGLVGGISNSLEVSAWVYLDPAAPESPGATLISTQVLSKGFFFGADASGKPTFVVYVTDGTTRAATALSATVPSAGWYHFVGSALAGKPIQLYVNGTSLASGGVIDKALSPSPQVAIGRASSTSTGFWKGPISEIRVYGN